MNNSITFSEWSALIDTIDFTGDRYEKIIRPLEATLSAGFHYIRLEPETHTGDVYFLLDFVEFFARNP